MGGKKQIDAIARVDDRLDEMQRIEAAQLAAVAPPPAVAPLSAEELAGLTDDDLRRMCRDSLAMMIHANRGELRALAAIKEAIDRIDGKAVDRSVVMANVQVSQEKISRKEIARRLAYLAVRKEGSVLNTVTSFQSTAPSEGGRKGH